MTERNLPTEEQKEYKIWTKYFLKRLEDAGIEDAGECYGMSFGEDKPIDSHASILYEATSPQYTIGASIRIKQKLLAESETLDDLIDESFTLATEGNFYIGFDVKDGVAKAHVIDWGDKGDSDIDFVDGQEYNPREVLDALFSIFLQDYHNQRPSK